jgi:hypothetical protein
MTKQKVDDARVHLWTIAGSSLFESLPMNENGSHDVSELPKENLKAGRRFYYLVVAVALFLRK